MLDTISKWVAMLALMLSIGNIVWAWISQPARDLEERVDEICEDLKNHDRRIQRNEDDLRHLPTKDDLNEVANKLVGVKTELDIIARVVTRIDDYLRNQS